MRIELDENSIFLMMAFNLHGTLGQKAWNQLVVNATPSFIRATGDFFLKVADMREKENDENTKRIIESLGESDD